MSSSAAAKESLQSAGSGPATTPASTGRKNRNKKKKNNAHASAAAANSSSNTSNTKSNIADNTNETNGTTAATTVAETDVSRQEPTEASEVASASGPDEDGPGNAETEDNVLEEADSLEPTAPEQVEHESTSPRFASLSLDTRDEPKPSVEQDTPISASNGHAGASKPPGTTSTQPTATTTQLATMSQDSEQVERLRKQLEALQEAHAEEVAKLRTDLEESEAAKEQAETQYQALMGRLERIKETLGDRLKRDKAELEEAKDKVEELETQNDELRRTLTARDEETTALREEHAEQARELASLRSRSNLSQQNWQSQKDLLARQVDHLRAELETTTAAMGEWEVIAMEERSVRESLTEKVGDLEEQLANAREALERAVAEQETQSQATDRLQRALRELQETRRKELREMVEETEQQVQALKKRANEADARATEAEAAKEALAKELERAAPFEKEVKEKNLLIGKLRHEAIVLNDHLTKALKYIKKTKPEETIDRQIVTNHFLQFLTLDRSDPKKFQILQVIAGLLGWTDEQRERAGLARPGGGTSVSSLRLPASPFHRTPSSPALNSDFFSESATAGSGKESLADLWAGFLERSVEEAGATGGGGGQGPRKDSVSSMGGLGITRPDTRG